MQTCIIIPVHNEAYYIKDCLRSFINQTETPNQLIIVDDNSTDDTFEITSNFVKNYPWIKVVQHQSSTTHLPGEKIIKAFYFGLQHADDNYDLIGKFDADIILPSQYFEIMQNHFKSNRVLAMCSGLLHVKKEGKWVYENIANKSHVRGPVKLYNRRAFERMNGLRYGVGWDTVDALLCQYHDFEIKTDQSLIVKHLRPTGHGYSIKNHRAKGIALYQMRYDLTLAKIALLKMSWQAKKPMLYFQGVFGYLEAWLKRLPRFVCVKEGKFIRKLRWKGIRSSLF